LQILFWVVNVADSGTHPNLYLEPIPVGGPFEMVAMDVLQLPVTKTGNKYVLVMSDYFTRWPEAVALPDQRPETIARALIDNVISRHGILILLNSDQGPNFESAVIKDMCRLLGMSKVRTTAYHPQCDGLVERPNRTLISMLAKYCKDCPTEWDAWLPVLLGAYRSAKQAPTGYSPFEMLYGRSVRLPSDEYFEKELPEPLDPTSYMTELPTAATNCMRNGRG
jgi:hypothetical protein